MQKSEFTQACRNVIGNDLVEALFKGSGVFHKMLQLSIHSAFVYGKGSSEDHAILKEAGKTLSELGHFNFSDMQKRPKKPKTIPDFLKD